MRTLHSQLPRRHARLELEQLETRDVPSYTMAGFTLTNNNLYNTQGTVAVLIDTNVTDFQAANGLVYDHHLDGSLYAMNPDGTAKSPIDVHVAKWLVSPASGSVFALTTSGTLDSNGQATSFTGIQDFTFEPDGQLVLMNNGTIGNLMRSEGVDGTGKIDALGSGVAKMFIDGAGWLVVLDRWGNLTHVYADRASGGLLDMGVIGVAIDGQGWTAAVDSKGTLLTWAPGSSSSFQIGQAVTSFSMAANNTFIVLDKFGELYRYFAGMSGGAFIDNNVQQFTLSDAGNTLNVWEKQTPLTQSPTVSESLFISQQDINALRVNPELITSLFQKYEAALSAILGPAYSGLTQEGLLAVFCSVAAYQLGPYRPFGDPSPAPIGYSLSLILKPQQEYVCNEYDALAVDLFRLAAPQAVQDGLKLYMVGWNGGTVGNHAQLLVTGGGVPLLLDPTNGLVAETDFLSLLNGAKVPASWVCQVSERIDYNAYVPGEAAALAGFDQEVINAIENGTYTRSSLLYLIDTDVALPTSGGAGSPINIGYIPDANGGLYILAPNAPASYANLTLGYWITTNSGVVGINSVDDPNLGWTFTVATGDGSVWGVTPQNPWTLE